MRQENALEKQESLSTVPIQAKTQLAGQVQEDMLVLQTRPEKWGLWVL